MRSAILLLICLSACGQAPAPGISGDSKWTRIIAESHYQSPDKPFHGNLLAALKKLQKKYQKIPYVTDQENYGVEDYWATREEMQAKGSGDCEDFAIAEYYDLLELGVSDKKMEILIAYNTNGEQHAILSVGKYVLDNRSDRVITLKYAERHYSMIYALNRIAWGPITKRLT